MSLGHSHLLNSGRVGLLCLCASVAILAATVDFAGVVRSMDGLAVVQEQIHIDTGGTYRTSDSGEFTIPASEGLKVGAEVVFHVSHWVVLRPCELQNGRTYLPAQGRPIQMKVLRPGDPRLKSIVPVESALGCTIEEAAAQFPRDFVLKKRRKSSRANWPEPSVYSGLDKAYAFAADTSPHVDRSRVEMVDVFAKKKIVFEENTMQNATERKDVYSRITAQIVEHLEKGFPRGYAPGTPKTQPEGLCDRYAITGSPTPALMSCPSGCPR